MFGRILAAFALLGPPLIGIVAPIVSFISLRNRRLKPSVIAVIIVLVVWLALCVGAFELLVSIAFNFAWSWAHVKRPPLISEELTLLGLIAGGLAILTACGYALHRFAMPRR